MKNAALCFLSFVVCLACCGCGDEPETVPSGGTTPPANSDTAEAPPTPTVPNANPATNPGSKSNSEPSIVPGTGAKWYRWEKGKPAVPVTHRDDGFAFLSGVGGDLLSPPKQIEVIVNAEGDWMLKGESPRAYITAGAYSMPWFGSIERPLPHKEWKRGQPLLRKLIHQKDGFCVLRRVGGGFRGGGETIRLRIAKDGYWMLDAHSLTGGTRAKVTVIKMKQPGSFQGVAREHSWKPGQKPVRLIHSNDGFAFLAGVSGKLAGRGEWVRVQRDDKDGYWYLIGQTGQRSLRAWAYSIRFPKTGTTPPVLAANDSPEQPASRQQYTIHGSWEIVEATEGGEKDDDYVGDVYVFSGDGKKFEIRIGGSNVNKLTFDCKIDADNKQVDYSLPNLEWLGLYKLEGDKLTLCLNQGERPAGFTSTDDDDNRLLVLKRLSAKGGSSPGKTASTNLQPASKADQAIAALKKLGFDVSEDVMKVDIGYSGGDKINDDDLVHFRSLPDVTELGLYEVPLTDKGIQHLSGLQKLQRLKLGNSKFTDAGLKIIGQLKNLEVFELGECENVTGAGLMHLKELTKMRELSLFYVEPGPGDLAFANDMLNLEAFHFVSNDDAPNESDLQVLGRLTKLSVLNLSGAGLLNNNTISHLSNLKSLTDLNLDYTSISDRAMQTVKEFTRLERLHLRGTRVDDLGMRSLAGMENLRELHLSGSKVGSRGISALADCPNLTELFLDSPETTDRHLAGLKDLKQLKKLYLSGDYDYTRKRSIPTRITLRGIQTLSVLEQLEQLHIKDNPQINDLAVPYLSKLKNLYVLKLEGTSITPQGGRKIADEIEGLDYDDLGL